jgi:hypothetical protein
MDAKPLTAEEINALRLFAALNGRYWKAALRDLWENFHKGRDWDDAATILYRLRNSHGPTWLVQFRLPK